MKLWICTISIILMSQSTHSAIDCCPKGNILNGNSCVSSNKTITNVLISCVNGMYMLDPHLESAEEYLVDDDGRLLMANSSHTVEKDSFCLVKISYVNLSSINDITADKYIKHEIALVCFPDDSESNLTHTVISVLSIISVIFLILTLIVYLVVPELRDLQGRITMCACAALALGFLHLTIAQYIYERDHPLCLSTAFGIYFWMIAAFFWMNIISINVMKTTVFHQWNISDHRMFLYYSVYGWGVPLILFIVILITHHADGDHIKPGFGDESCWFAGKVPTWTYFYAPMAVLLAANITIFIFTSIMLCKKSNYDNISKYRVMEYKFYLYVKLFLITGLSWIFEIISYAHDTKHFAWMLTDTFNALQGATFFLVLIVFRKRALRGLANKGFPVPCSSKYFDGIDEECDEIMKDEEVPTMTTTRP